MKLITQEWLDRAEDDLETIEQLLRNETRSTHHISKLSQLEMKILWTRGFSRNRPALHSKTSGLA